MRRKPSDNQREDPFTKNREAIALANLYLIKRVTFCAFINMALMSASSPFLGGFVGAAKLYMVCSTLTAAFCVFCYKWLDRFPKAVLPLFYCLMAALCAYAVALSVHYYKDIHGVTIIGIFMLVPMVILDRTLRINTVFFLIYAVSSILALICKPRAIAIDDIVTSGAFMVFGMFIGAYLRSARLQAIDQSRQLEFQRNMDELTHLPNRRLLFETLGRADKDETGRSLRGVFMIDIDDFKGYNDRFGHQAGDQCLRSLGAFLLGFAHDTGMTVYRYGGEEFLGLLPWDVTVPPEELARRLVAGAHLSGVFDRGVTISVGYACREDTSISSEKLISMADSALYEAKRQGHDRAVAYTPKAENVQPSPSIRKRSED